MPSRWRPGQISYNEKTPECLARASGARFRGREIAVMLYAL